MIFSFRGTKKGFRVLEGAGWGKFVWSQNF